MTRPKWKPGTILVANLDGGDPEPISGLVTRNLGLYRPGRSRKLWHLLHLNTGLRIAHLRVDLGDAKRIATIIHSWVDWSMVAESGWRNQCPDLPQRLEALLYREGCGYSIEKGVAPQHDPITKAAAEKVARARGV